MNWEKHMKNIAADTCFGVKIVKKSLSEKTKEEILQGIAKNIQTKEKNISIKNTTKPENPYHQDSSFLIYSIYTK